MSIYYIDPLNGSLENSGTSPTDAWGFIYQSNEFDLQPGDIVEFLGDETIKQWNDVIIPKNSGTKGNPITYRCETGHQTTLANNYNKGHTIKLNKEDTIDGLPKDYITIQGFRIVNKYWGRIDETVGVILENLTCMHRDEIEPEIEEVYGGDYWGVWGFRMEHSSYSIIRNNEFYGCQIGQSQDILQIKGIAHHNLIEYNMFHDAGHTTISMSGNNFDLGIIQPLENDSRFNVIRNNYFFNKHHQGPVSNVGGYYTLYENNFLERAGTGTKEGERYKYPDNGNELGAFDYGAGTYGIIRNNIISRAGSSQWWQDSADTWYTFGTIDGNTSWGTTGGDFEGNIGTSNTGRIFNNIFYKNWGTVIAAGSGLWNEPLAGSDKPLYQNHIYKNNIFFKNGEPGENFPGTIWNKNKFEDVFIYYANLGGTTEEKENWNDKWISNLMEDTDNNNILLYSAYTNGKYKSLADLSGPIKDIDLPGTTWENNIQDNPLFIDPDGLYDRLDLDSVRNQFALDQNSPCIDTGDYLTFATNTGTNASVIEIDDPHYFVGGNNSSNWNGIIPGDTIQIGSEIVNIISIDYTAKTLQIDRNIDWLNNEKVSMPFDGAKPNMGLYTTVVTDIDTVEWTEDGLRILTKEASIDTSVSITSVANNLIATDNITLEAWVIPENLTQDGPARLMTFSKDGSFRNFTLSQEAGNYQTRLVTTNTDDNGRPPTGDYLKTATDSVKTELQHVVFTYDGNNRSFYLNGNINSTDDGILTGEFDTWDLTYLFGIANEFNSIDRDRFWLGEFKLLAVYDKALTATEVLQNYNAGYGVTTIGISPTITSQTTGTITSKLGEYFELLVTAEGDPILTYQWYKNNVKITGATNNIYYVIDSTNEDAGTYYCIVTNGITPDAISQDVSIAISTPTSAPLITGQPEDQRVSIGSIIEPAFFNVTVAGDSLVYQWYKDGTEISGATADSYTYRTSLPADDGAKFNVIITNSFGSDISDDAVLTVYTASTSLLPVEFLLVEGGDLNVYIYWNEPNEDSNVYYEIWYSDSGIYGSYFKRTDITEFGVTDYVDTNFSSYGQTRWYYFNTYRQSTGELSKKSEIISGTTKLLEILQIIKHPENITVAENSTATFTVEAVGSNLTYQWQRNNIDIQDAYDSTYTTSLLTLQDSNVTFRCNVISNLEQSIYSDSALLIVSGEFPIITEHPTEYVSVYEGVDVNFTIVSSNTDFYQWQEFKNIGDASGDIFDWVDLSGETNSILTLYNVEVVTERQFRCVCNNNAGSTISNVGHLTVSTSINIAPTITISTDTTDVNETERVTFISTVTGTEPISYQWKKNNIDIETATSPIYTTLPLTIADNNSEYSCIASNLESTESNLITLTVNEVVRNETNQLVAYNFNFGSGTQVYDINETFEQLDLRIQDDTLTQVQWITPSGLSFSGIENGTSEPWINRNGERTDPIPDVNTKMTTMETNNIASFEFWLKPLNEIQGSDTTAAQIFSYARSIDYRTISIGQSGNKYVIRIKNIDSSGDVFISSTDLVKSNESQHLVFNFNAPESKVDLYINDVLSHTYDLGDITTLSFPSHYVFALGGDPWGTYYWAGEMYLMRIYNQLMTIQQIHENYIAGYVGQPISDPSAILPEIIQQPIAQNVNEYDTANFTCDFSGPSNKGYQWWKNGTIKLENDGHYSGVDTFRLSISNCQNVEDGDTFMCECKDLDFYPDAGSWLNSDSVILSVTDVIELFIPIITTQPTDKEIVEGSSAEFTVIANGNPIPEYEWQEFIASLWESLDDNASFSGTKTNTFTVINPPSSTIDRSFRCHVTNSEGFIDTDIVSLSTTDAPVAPSITQEPADQQIVNKTEFVSFSITATGTAPLSYQWFKDSVEINGATSNIYNLTSAILSDAGVYYCIVTNDIDIATSENSVLIVNEVAVVPTITISTVDPNVLETEIINFSSSVTGTEPITYQWYKNNEEILNAISPTYTTPSLSLEDDSAVYYCKASNIALQNVQSNSITITVTEVVRIESNPIISYDFNYGSGTTIYDTTDVVPEFDLRIEDINTSTWINPTGINFTGGIKAYASRNGESRDNSKITVLDNTKIASFEFWLKPANILQGDDVNHSIIYGSLRSTTYRAFTIGQSGNKYAIRLRNIDNAGDTFLSDPDLVKADEPQHLVFNYDLNNSKVDLYINSNLSHTFDISNITTLDFPLGDVSILGSELWGDGLNRWTGEMYLMRINNVLLSESNISNNYIAGFDGLPTQDPQPVLPNITIQPITTTINEYEAATFNCDFSGPSNKGYQWFKNDVDELINDGHYSGVDTFELTISSVQYIEDGTTFKCNCRDLDFYPDAESFLDSDVVILNVVDVIEPYVPVINSQPEDILINEGSNGLYQLSADGNPTPVYEWQEFIASLWEVLNDNASFSGTKTNTFTVINPLYTSLIRRFRCRVYNSEGSTLSNEVDLSITQNIIAPAVTVHPINQEIVENQNVSFSIAATGTVPLTYQWYENGVPISEVISTNNILNLINVPISKHNYIYYCIVSNSGGSDTSGNATLIVNEIIIAPTITTQPLDSTVNEGEPVTFNIVATGTEPLSYQWYKDSIVIVNEIYDTLYIASASSVDSGLYYCIVTNLVDSIQSSTATLTINVTYNRTTDNLIALWNFNENGGTVINDITDNPINANIMSTYNGATWHPGYIDLVNDTTIRSDVATGIVDILSVADEFTAEVWTQPHTNTETSSPWGNAIFALEQSNFYGGFWIYQNADKYLVKIESGPNNGEVETVESTPNSIITTEPQHVVISLSNVERTLNIYINGQLNTTGSIYDFNYITSTSRILFGSQVYNNYFYHGNIYLASIYNRVLNETEIYNNFMSGPNAI